MTGLKPFFNYYGGKWRDAPKYPRPKHSTIVEPFAGSAGYSLRYHDRNVVLCDSDPVIAGLWSWLVRASSSEILSIPLLEEGQTTDDLPVCQEARWLVGFLIHKGEFSPSKAPSKWMRTEPIGTAFWGPLRRERIAKQVDQIRHWRVLNVSYTECPIGGTATWFVDPPYQQAGKHYRHGSGGINFERLGAWCRILPGQVIVCENAGAEWLDFEPFGERNTLRSGLKSSEVVWLKGCALDEGGAP